MPKQGHNICAVCAALLACFLVGCQGLAIGDRTRPVPILAQIQTDNSGFQYAAVELINSQAQLDSFGNTTLKGLDVDFKAHSLLVLALGERSTAGWSARITGVQTIGAEMFVQAICYKPHEGTLVNNVHTYPIAAAVIPKLQADLIHPEVEEITDNPPNGLIED